MSHIPFSPWTAHFKSDFCHPEWLAIVSLLCICWALKWCHLGIWAAAASAKISFLWLWRADLYRDKSADWRPRARPQHRLMPSTGIYPLILFQCPKPCVLWQPKPEHSTPSKVPLFKEGPPQFWPGPRGCESPTVGTYGHFSHQGHSRYLHRAI